jgi:hypothetical protein
MPSLSPKGYDGSGDFRDGIPDVGTQGEES